MRFVALTPALLAAIDSAEAPVADAGVLCVGGLATALIHDGQVLAAAGLVRVWPGRHYAWLRRGLGIGAAELRAAYRFIRRRLARLAADPAFRRIECTVACGDAHAVRFAERLGFRREGRMRAYAPDGADHFLFAKVT